MNVLPPVLWSRLYGLDSFWKRKKSRVSRRKCLSPGSRRQLRPFQKLQPALHGTSAGSRQRLPLQKHSNQKSLASTSRKSCITANKTITHVHLIVLALPHRQILELLFALHHVHLSLKHFSLALDPSQCPIFTLHLNSVTFEHPSRQNRHFCQSKLFSKEDWAIQHTVEEVRYWIILEDTSYRRRSSRSGVYEGTDYFDRLLWVGSRPLLEVIFGV